MKKNILYWAVALLITIVIAYYQRATGPTYPISGTFAYDGRDIKYTFFTSHAGEGPQKIEIPDKSGELEGSVYWKRYKTPDDFSAEKMHLYNGKLTAYLPHQPKAGKLEYFIVLKDNENNIRLPADENVVIRFRGDVPPFILIPHIITMFGAMLLSTRTGIEAFRKEPKLKKLTIWTTAFLFIGGLILGPIVQLYAFDALWTGFPFGHDLTDNKTAIAFLGWLTALIMIRKSPKPEKWVLFASILLLVVYLIPHSVLGSELDYNKLDKQNETINSLGE